MEINQIISLAAHCMHLCNNSNMEEIVFSYLTEADALVTNNIEEWKRKFNENKVSYPIKKPNEITPDKKIIVDGSSLGKDFEKWEEKWKKQNRAICIYNMDELDPSLVKQLVNIHDKMFLSVNKIRMLSDKNLEKEIEDLNPEIVEKLVKRELKSIILSMLLTKPMSGTDLVKSLYSKFKVFISPSMLYPYLYDLEKKGLLKYEYKLKNKIYSVEKKDQTELLLKKQVKAASLLSEFLSGEWGE